MLWLLQWQKSVRESGIFFDLNALHKKKKYTHVYSFSLFLYLAFSREYLILNCFPHFEERMRRRMVECGGERKEEHRIEIFQKKKKKSSSLKAANASRINGHPNFGFRLHFYQRLRICS